MATPNYRYTQHAQHSIPWQHRPQNPRDFVTGQFSAPRDVRNERRRGWSDPTQSGYWDQWSGYKLPDTEAFRNPYTTWRASRPSAGTRRGYVAADRNTGNYGLDRRNNIGYASAMADWAVNNPANMGWQTGVHATTGRERHFFDGSPYVAQRQGTSGSVQPLVEVIDYGAYQTSDPWIGALRAIRGEDATFSNLQDISDAYAQMQGTYEGDVPEEPTAPEPEPETVDPDAELNDRIDSINAERERERAEYERRMADQQNRSAEQRAAYEAELRRNAMIQSLQAAYAGATEGAGRARGAQLRVPQLGNEPTSTRWYFGRGPGSRMGSSGAIRNQAVNLGIAR